MRDDVDALVEYESGSVPIPWPAWKACWKNLKAGYFIFFAPQIDGLPK
jgi:hypothetical protein